MIVAILWDFDGVIVFTPHEDAWRLTAAKYGITNFTSEFYLRFVAGRPRLEGAQEILKYFGLLNELDEESRNKLITRFAEEKNVVFNELVSKGQYVVNHDALDFIEKTRIFGGVKFVHVLASASRNVAKLTKIISVGGRVLSDFFDVDVSGSSASKKEIFAIGMSRAGRFNCIMAIDDAPSGIMAARDLGIIPVGFRQKDLINYGARLVIEDFKQVDPEVLIGLCR